MTASTRFTIPTLAWCLVTAAVMQTAHAQSTRTPSVSPSPARGLVAGAARTVLRSSMALEITVVGAATPTLAERKDGYLGIEDVVPGDRPGEWVATTPHAAHWFDSAWRQVAVTDLEKRYRRTHPVRYEASGPVTLVAEEGNIDRLIEFDRRGRELGRIELRGGSAPVFADIDGDGVVEIAVASGKAVQLWRRGGARVRAIVFDEFVTDLDAVQATPAPGVELLVYSFLDPTRGAWLRIVDQHGERIRAWHEAAPARSSVVNWGTGPRLVSHRDGSLRIRDLTGRVIDTRESPHAAETRYTRAVRLPSGHEVFLCYNRFRDAHVLLIYNPAGQLVHAERPASFASTLWTVAADPGAFYVAVGPEIVRYRIRP